MNIRGGRNYRGRKHRAPGLGLNKVQKATAQNFVDMLFVKDTPKMQPQDFQDLMIIWDDENENGSRIAGMFMTFREYIRTLAEPYIRKERDYDNDRDLWDMVEDAMKEYMGNEYYNKI